MNTISGTAGDTGGSGLSTVNITIYNVSAGKYWNGAVWASGVNWSSATFSDGPWSSWTYTSSGVTWSNGTTYIVNATAVDNASNVDGSPDSNTFYYDLDGVTSEVIAISGYWKNSSDNPLTITGTASDAGSGLKNVTLYYYNSTDNSTWTGPPLIIQLGLVHIVLV